MLSILGNPCHNSVPTNVFLPCVCRVVLVKPTLTPYPHACLPSTGILPTCAASALNDSHPNHLTPCISSQESLPMNWTNPLLPQPSSPSFKQAPLQWLKGILHVLSNSLFLPPSQFQRCESLPSALSNDTSLTCLIPFTSAQTWIQRNLPLTSPKPRCI